MAPAANLMSDEIIPDIPIPADHTWKHDKKIGTGSEGTAHLRCVSSTLAVMVSALNGLCHRPGRTVHKYSHTIDLSVHLRRLLSEHYNNLSHWFLSHSS